MQDPTTQEIEITVLELQLACEIARDLPTPDLQPHNKIKLAQVPPENFLSITWGTQPADRAVIYEGKAHRHGE